MWRKTMTYLGLGPDEEYEDDGYYDDPVDADPRSGPVRPASPVVRPAQPTAGPRIPSPSEDGDVRVVSAVRTLPPEPASAPAPAPVPAPSRAPVEDVVPLDANSAVRAMPAPSRARPHVVSPTSFDDAMDIGTAFKGGLPVIMNLGEADRDLARRLIDFASGICFALDGSMERVAPQVYLITPTDVEVSDDDRRRLQERGLHR
jgi:cell division inhibitor SepF